VLVVLVAVAMGCAGRPGAALPADVAPPAVEVARAGPPVRTDATIAGHEVIRVVPPSPRGGVLLLHGASASADAWFRRAEMRTFVEGLVDAGYAVVAVSSADRSEARWDASGIDSEDVRGLRAVRDTLVADGEVPAGSPWFAVGHSQGGAAAVLAGAALGLDGLVVSHSPGATRVEAPVPRTLFVAASGDTIVPASRVRLGHEALQRAGAETALLEVGPTPIDAARLAAATGRPTADAERLLAALRAGGLVADDGAVRAHPLVERARWEAALASAWPDVTREERVELRDALLVAVAEHPFTASVLPEVLRWLAASSPPGSATSGQARPRSDRPPAP
jgi:hypothetical protein